MMDDFTYLGMNFLKKISNEYENILLTTSQSPSHVYHWLIFKNNLSIGIAPPQIDVEKMNGIKREGGRGKEKRCFKSCFLDPLLDKMPTP